jgi:hypothetical protein
MLNIFQEDLSNISEDLLSINLDMIDIKSLRLLRSLSLNLIHMDEYRNFQTALDIFLNMNIYDSHMIIDDNYSMSLTEQNLIFLQALHDEFTSNPLHDHFEFKFNFMEDFGYFFKNAFIKDKKHHIGLIFCNLSELQSEFTQELFYWDLMALTKVLKWNLVVINLENQPTQTEVKNTILRLIESIKD